MNALVIIKEIKKYSESNNNNNNNRQNFTYNTKQLNSIHTNIRYAQNE